MKKGVDLRCREQSAQRRICLIAATMLAGVTAHGVQAAEPVAKEESLSEVVVTGSCIRRQDMEATSPTVTASQELFEDTATVGVETVLNQLPQFVPAATMFSSTTNRASATVTPGASLVNLRGLGSIRTLTLIDGRRATPLNAQLNVDTNTIPSSAVERVEIISGGASAVYGADAVAGVVNFILKDRFEDMDPARWGITEKGDGKEPQVSGLLGTLFSDNRGNFMVGLEYADPGRAYNTNRDWLRREVNPALTLRAGIDNLFDQTPPLAGGAYAADGEFVSASLNASRSMAIIGRPSFADVRPRASRTPRCATALPSDR